MKHKHKANRRDYPDSRIMDALDAAMFSIKEAADMLGLNKNTLRNWIKKSDNLSNYLQLKQEEYAEEIETQFMEILRRAKTSKDPRVVSNSINAGKALLDKIKASKSEIKAEQTVTHLDLSEEAKKKLDELLGEDAE